MSKKVQVSIVIDEEMKKEFSRLAVKLDMSFSHLVRHALRELKKQTPKK